MIRVVIAEDQQMLRGALTSLLQLEDDIDVVAQVSNGEDALDAIERHQPDISILDIEIPGMTGLDVAEQIRQRGIGTKIMIVTTFARPGYLQKAMDLKVDGYVLKDEPIDEFVGAIRKIMNGGRVVSPDLIEALFNREENPLTEREQEVLRLAKEGKTTRQMAKTLYLSYGTVRNYLSSAIQKLEAESRHHAVLIAEEKGWI
ncbi:response regulator transcription factor [Novibacillus thermophilus]|jgi:two-component system response regulator DesR|uniref:DNA-binding response regulator n=1 Tax=Novibacillus thermophilus TaxID=1471761 RepID=A0A1U9K3Z9_9BACL|nr:response regulator transcription factor [Novibacillus thermophilus]AQS54758.1 DNA-binding response regulator [Novibacillus thermophilus]